MLLAGGDSGAWRSDFHFARGARPARGPGAELAAAGSPPAASGDCGGAVGLAAAVKARGRGAELGSARDAGSPAAGRSVR